MAEKRKLKVPTLDGKPFKAPCAECGRPSVTLVCCLCYAKDYPGMTPKESAVASPHRHNGIPFKTAVAS